MLGLRSSSSLGKGSIEFALRSVCVDMVRKFRDDINLLVQIKAFLSLE